MKFLILVSICLIFLKFDLFSQVKIITFNNYEFYGVITEESTDTLKLYTADKMKIIIPKKNIIVTEQIKGYIKQNNSETYAGRFSSFSEKGIVLEGEDGTVRHFDFYMSQISFDGSLDKLYPFLGLTALMPGGLNLHFGHYVSKYFGVAFSLGTMEFFGGDLTGIQASLLYSLDRNKYFDHNLGLGFGYMDIGQTYDFQARDYVDKTWQYVSLTYDINIRGFFIQPGFSVGSGSFSNPQLMIQAGYVYRFND